MATTAVPADKESWPAGEAAAMSEEAAQRRRVRRAIVGLGISQMVGWGSTFSPLTIMGGAIAADLAVSREAAFAGITVMLVAGAIVAPACGRLVDRYGARWTMAAGSVIMALSLVLLAQANGLAAYLAGWGLVGLGAPLALHGAVPGLVQVVGPDARRAITWLMLISGMTSTLFLPLHAYLLDVIGWRSAFLVYAALHIVLALPAHLLVLVSRAPAPEVKTVAEAPAAGAPPRRWVVVAFLLLALWSGIDGLIMWGLSSQIVDALKDQGLSNAAAITLWMIVGPFQVVARIGDLVTKGRFPILAVGIVSVVLPMIGYAVLIGAGVSIWSGIVFSIVFGFGHGLFVIARSTLPLMLFGHRELAAYMGRLLLPQNLANAASPVVFAFVMTAFGGRAVLILAAGLAAISLVAILLLARHCRNAAALKPV